MGVGGMSKPHFVVTPLMQFLSLWVSDDLWTSACPNHLSCFWWHLSCNSVVYGYRMKLWSSTVYNTSHAIHKFTGVGGSYEPQLLITPLMQLTSLWVSGGTLNPSFSYHLLYNPLFCACRREVLASDFDSTFMQVPSSWVSLGKVNLKFS